MNRKMFWLSVIVIGLLIFSIVSYADSSKTKEDKLKDKIKNDFDKHDKKNYDKNNDLKIKHIDENKGITTADIEVNNTAWKMITSSN